MSRVFLVVLVTTFAVFAGKQMSIHTPNGITKFRVADIDSIKFFDTTITSAAPRGMKLIPAKDSSFTMGLSNGDYSQLAAFTKDFYMDSTQVTQKDYNDLMKASYSGYTTPKWSSSDGLGDKKTANFVNWFDAVLYCNARSKRDSFDTLYTYTSISGTPGDSCELSDVKIDFSKRGYRLATEAEWEYAVRAGSTTDFFWGKNYGSYPKTQSDTAEVGKYAIWKANSLKMGTSSSLYGINDVASKLPNGFGLYDMSGNAWDWCNDWFADYSGSLVTDYKGVTTGTERVIRGGGWHGGCNLLRSGIRHTHTPEYRSNSIGFRAVFQK